MIKMRRKYIQQNPIVSFSFFYLLINDQEKFIILKELFLFLLLYG
jgi:hypothetical protein